MVLGIRGFSGLRFLGLPLSFADTVSSRHEHPKAICPFRHSCAMTDEVADKVQQPPAFAQGLSIVGREGMLDNCDLLACLGV